MNRIDFEWKDVQQQFVNTLWKFFCFSPLSLSFFWCGKIHDNDFFLFTILYDNCEGFTFCLTNRLSLSPSRSANFWFFAKWKFLSLLVFIRLNFFNNFSRIFVSPFIRRRRWKFSIISLSFSRNLCFYLLYARTLADT